MRITGLGDSCSSSLSPSNCAAAGGVYDGDNEVCTCGASTTPTPVVSGFTLAQQIALCNNAGADTSWNYNTGTCDSIGSAPAPGTTPITTCANNTLPGTPSDVNCPWWCAWVDYLPGACTPCQSICPTGTVWDTTNNICTSTPVTTNCNAKAGVTCPSYCSIPLVSSFSTACTPCASNTGVGSSLAAVGAAVLLFLGYKLLSR